MRLIGNSSDYPSIGDSIISYKQNMSNLDNICDYYKLNKKDCVMYFSNYSFLKKYEHILRGYAKPYQMEEKFKYKPEYVSNELYGSPDLWYLILFLNGCETHTKFDTSNSVFAIPPQNISVLIELYNEEKENIHTSEKPLEVNDQFLVKNLVKESDHIFEQPISKIDPILPNNSVGNKNYDFWLQQKYSSFQNMLYMGGLNSSIDNITSNLTYKYPMQNKQNMNIISGSFYEDRQQTITIRPLYIGRLTMNINGNAYLFNNDENFILSNRNGKIFNKNDIINDTLIVRGSDFLLNNSNSLIVRYEFSAPPNDNSSIKIRGIYEDGSIEENSISSYKTGDTTNNLIDIFSINKNKGNLSKIEINMRNISKDTITQIYLYNYDFDEKQIRVLAKSMNTININYINNPEYNFINIAKYSSINKNLNKFSRENLFYTMTQKSLYGRSITYLTTKSIGKKVYNKSIDIYDDLSISINPKVYPHNKSFNITKEFYMKVISGKQYRLIGKQSEYITSTANGKDFLTKLATVESSNIYECIQDQNLKIELTYSKVFGTENNDYFRIEYRDSITSEWKRVPNSSIYCKKEFIDDNQINSIDKSKINLKGYYNGINIIRDINYKQEYFELSCYMSSTFKGNNGAMGIVFKIKGTDDYMLYSITYDDQHSNDKCLLSGLYYINNKEKVMNLNSNPFDTIKGKKLKATKQSLSGNNIKPTFVNVKVYDNMVRVYSGISENTLILEENLLGNQLIGGYGFFIYNMDDPLIDEILVKYPKEK